MDQDRPQENQRRAISPNPAKTEKLESIGQFAYGVAHEINNPLGYIDSNLSTLNQYVRHLLELMKIFEEFKTAMSAGDLMKASQIRDQINEMEGRIDLDYILTDIETLIRETREGVEKIKGIILSLRSFASLSDTKTETVDLNKALELIVDNMACQVNHILFVKKLSSLPEVECDVGQMKQAVVAILKNSFRAMPEGGTITVTTGAKKMVLGDPGVGRRKQDPFREGDTVVSIALADTGHGIPEEVLPKIFDPFFTTQKVNKGMGLGLSLAFDIVKKHQGWIHVQSRVDDGAVMTVYLPVRRKKKGSQE